jgi:hypothetical protein
MTSHHPVPQSIPSKSTKLSDEFDNVNVDRLAATDVEASVQESPCSWDKTAHRLHCDGTNPSHHHRSDSQQESSPALDRQSTSTHPPN